MSLGSPLYRDALALCGVLLEELEEERPGTEPFEVLRRGLGEGALDLLGDICLALSGLERLSALESADARLCVLRGRLQLGLELGLLGEELFLELAEQADTVGRQIGGWLKKERRR